MGKGNFEAQCQLVSKPNPHDGFELPKLKLREIVVKKEDDVVNTSKHEQPLSPMACLTSNGSFDSCILTIVGFKKKIDIKSMEIFLQNNLAKHQRFSSVVVRDKHNNLKWCLREMVIEDHVIVPSLSSSTLENPNFINEYTSSLVTAPPLNPCRPLWEVHVLNVPCVDAAASIVFRIHHSLGDSVSMLSLIINSATRTADPHMQPTIPQHKSSDRKSTCSLQVLYNVVVGLWLTFLCLIEYVATLLWKRDRNLLSEERMAKTGSKRLAHVTLSIEDICLVKNAVNGTLNDVILGALSAGLLRYMSRLQYAKNTSVPQKTATSKDANGSASGEQHDLPLNMTVRTMIAVNMRPFTVLKDLERNMKNPSKSQWGNKVGLWVFPLPMLQYGDPLQYCRVTRMRSRRKKLSFEASLSYLLTQLFPIKLVAYLVSKCGERTTASYSNVMGPVEEIQFSDNPITHIIPTAHVKYHSVVMHFISYAGKGKLVALVSEEVIPDPQQLCQDCADALQLMKEAAAAKTTPP